MPILLESPLHGGNGGLWSEPLREGPRFIRGSRNGRWHIPRSGLTPAGAGAAHRGRCGADPW